ncbi:MAG: 4-alpha-glucanotransferase [Acidobacteria bacterium]|nr:4-alpha-glucanotransferase [Acidobacteriota bacterium]
MNLQSSDGRAELHRLWQLSRLYGIQLAYRDAFARFREASPEALLGALRALGAPVDNLDHVADALRERRQRAWRQVLQPVIVAWDGVPPRIRLRLEERRASGPAAFRVRLETGLEQSWTFDMAQAPVEKAIRLEGTSYVAKRIVLPEGLPPGYHRFQVEFAGQAFESLLIVAPVRAYQQPLNTWGVFLPLYALHSRKSWGAGDFSDFETFADWVARFGGGVVSTLPFLSAFLKEFFDPSPYSPASRLFWNEFFVNPTKPPEFGSSEAARQLVESPEFQEELEELQAAPLVDYRRQMVLKRRVLEKMAQRLVKEKPEERYAAFRLYVDSHPRARDYAQFRAAVEQRQSPWTEWPEPLRSGALRPGDYDADAELYHLYAQWLAEEQVSSLARRTRSAGLKLYLDVPLGVHPLGFDVWRYRERFAMNASTGAPPDTVFTGGQNWGTPPLHPETIRQHGHDYLIACLRHQFSHAGMVRFDHVMGFHRLFWVPKGMESRDGVYVRYRAEEFYAIVSLESHRHSVHTVGENLGTVPNYVNVMMAHHGVRKLYVAEYEIWPDPAWALRPPQPDCVASLNTHDMPSFASFLKGLDIELRLQLGLIKEEEAFREREARRAVREALAAFLSEKGHSPVSWQEPHRLLQECLTWLMNQPPGVVLVNLEDLWLETEPQNVPGVAFERPNWRCKTRFPWEAIRSMSEVTDLLKNLGNLRRQPQAAAHSG